MGGWVCCCGVGAPLPAECWGLVLNGCDNFELLRWSLLDLDALLLLSHDKHAHPVDTKPNTVKHIIVRARFLFDTC